MCWTFSGCSGTEKFSDAAEGRETCNHTEFAVWMGVSRQTVYNWKECSYLMYTGNKVNLPATFELWSSLPWLGSK